MQTSDLQTFLAVADERSFSAAAARLNITQPAVTKRIKALEASLNSTLFDRVGKRVHLTDAGRLLLPKARELITALDDTQRLLSNLNERVSGTLRLATSHHVGLHRLAPALKSFSQAFPDVDLDIRFEDSEAAHDLVRRADSELAVVTLNPEGDSTLTCQPLWDDPLCFMVASDHRLALNPTIELSALARHPAILPGLATYTGRIVANLFEARQIPLISHLATNYLETISMLVRIGLGWSVLPASMLDDGLAKLSTDAPELHRTLGLVTHPQRTRSSSAAAFIEVLEGLSDAGLRV